MDYCCPSLRWATCLVGRISQILFCVNCF
jgi:hypothetical protein